jgi:RecQ zinc-binding
MNQSTGKEKDRTKQSQESFQKLVKYCETYNICRHKLINDYFCSEKSTITVCQDKRCDVCKNPEKIKAAATEYFNSRPLIHHSLLEIPTTTVSLLNSGFQSAKLFKEPVRLKDGSVASFNRAKRSYEEHFVETTVDELNKTEYTGFQSATALLGQQGGIEFGKKKAKKFAIEAKNDKSKAQFATDFPHINVPGVTNEIRDKFINMAIEIEAKCYMSVKLLVMYQTVTVKQLRSLSTTDFSNFQTQECTNIWATVLKN